MSKDMTLLEKAKQRRVKKIRGITQDEIDLSLAWLREEISTSDVSRAYGTYQSGNVLYRIAIALREACRTGKLEVK